MIISTTGVKAAYGPLEALHAVDFQVDTGEVVAILGANGAGKTTLLNVIAGTVPAAAGTVLIDDAPLSRKSPSMAARGITLVPEGRHLFANMSVQENLFLGAYTRPAWRDRKERAEEIFELLPALRDLRHQRASSLSGGEQQMVAIGRALMLKPRVLMLDEPSLGLAPLIVERIYDLVRTLAADGTTIVCVEQFVDKALSVANRIYVLDSGSVVFEGTPDAVRQDHDIFSLYLGGEPQDLVGDDESADVPVGKEAD